jgi:hypothetical protein
MCALAGSWDAQTFLLISTYQIGLKWFSERKEVCSGALDPGKNQAGLKYDSRHVATINNAKSVGNKDEFDLLGLPKLWMQKGQKSVEMEEFKKLEH